MSLLYNYLRQNRRNYLLGGIFLLGTNAFALLIPWLLKLAVDSLRNPAAAGRSPAFYAMLIIAAALSQGVIRVFSRTTLLHAARHIEFQIREKLYAHLLFLDLPYFSRERTGDILSRFSNDLTNVRMLTGFGVLNIINTCIIYLAALALMVRISPFLTMCSVIPFPLMILAVKRISASMFRRSLRAQEELARLSGKVEENVSAAALIRAYCREEGEIEAFRAISGEYLASNMAMARLRGVMIPIMAATGALGTLIVLFLGGSRVIAGELTLGDFVAFNGYLTMLIWPTIIMGWILNLLQRGAASMSRLNHILQARPQVAEPPAPEELPETRGEIEIRNLTFGYDAELLAPPLPPSPQPSPARGEGEKMFPPPSIPHPIPLPQGEGNASSPPGGGEIERGRGGGGGEGDLILKGISLTIKKGTRLGIVGPIGSGKSTLVRLIPRLYPVADGMLFIDGVDVNKLPLHQLRDAIGFVPQESFLFSRTVGDNIGYGREGASDEEIEAAARMAGFAPDVARFPEGFGTTLGERGMTLSGGQKQRAAIARALLKDPAILILDDPLSAVDTRTEEAILESLAGYYGDRTVLIVSHRLSALRGCDLIAVLDGGRIVERGSHEELLALNGRYAAIWREQQLRAEIEKF